MHVNQGLEGGPDPAFPLLSYENPASRPALFLSLSRIQFLFQNIYLKKD